MTEKGTKQNKTQQEEKKVQKRKFRGIVVNDKMDKTITVRVGTVKQHPKYKKRYYESRKFKVHDEKNQFQKKDYVDFIECRPLSKSKRWRVVYKDK